MQGEPPKPPNGPEKPGLPPGTAVLVVFCVAGGFLTLIALTAVVAYFGWVLSGTGTGAWVGGGFVFITGVWCVARFVLRESTIERGVLLGMFLVLGVVGYLTWLVYVSRANP